MSDRLTGWVRTVTPKLWAVIVTSLLAWFAVHAPWILELLELLGVDLASPTAIAFVVLLVDAVVLAVWQWVWTRLQPHLPDAVARFLMGSAKLPAYGVVDVTAPAGYEVAEVSEAKTEITDWLGQNYYEGIDNIHAGDRIVEGLVARGWRPTR